MSAEHVWALVTDGMRAHILRDLEGDQGDDPAPMDLVMRAHSDRLRSYIGRPQDAAQDALSAPREILQPDLDPFAAEIAAELDRHRLAGDFDTLAVFAPEAVARAITRHMTPGLLSTIFLERPAILVSTDEKAMRQAVRSAIW